MWLWLTICKIQNTSLVALPPQKSVSDNSVWVLDFRPLGQLSSLAKSFPRYLVPLSQKGSSCKIFAWNWTCMRITFPHKWFRTKTSLWHRGKKQLGNGRFQLSFLVTHCRERIQGLTGICGCWLELGFYLDRSCFTRHFPSIQILFGTGKMSVN